MFLGDRPSLQSPSHHSPQSIAHSHYHSHATTHADSNSSTSNAGAAQNRLEAIRKSSPPPSATSSSTSRSPRGSPPPPSAVREAGNHSVDSPPDVLHQLDSVPHHTSPAQEAELLVLSPAVVLPGVWHFANLESANNSSSAFALSISSSGQFELWERAITATGVELRGMAGLVSVLATSAIDGRPALAIRLTKTAERLVCSGGESTLACAPQAADGTVVSIDEATHQVALDFHAFGTRLIFWRAC